MILFVVDTFDDVLEVGGEDDSIIVLGGDPPPPAALSEFDVGDVLVDIRCSRCCCCCCGGGDEIDDPDGDRVIDGVVLVLAVPAFSLRFNA